MYFLHFYLCSDDICSLCKLEDVSRGELHPFCSFTNAVFDLSVIGHNGGINGVKGWVGCGTGRVSPLTHQFPN